MNINEEFPSKYLKAADLKGRTVTVTISHLERDKIGNDSKLVMFFVGKEKGMVLNRTNANNIAIVYGQDTDNWEGGEVQLYPAMVDFKGQSVEALRVKALPARRAPAAQASNSGNERFAEEGSYGRVTSGRPQRNPDDSRTMVDDRDTEQQQQVHELNDDIPF